MGGLDVFSGVVSVEMALFGKAVDLNSLGLYVFEGVWPIDFKFSFTCSWLSFSIVSCRLLALFFRIK